MGLYFYSLTLLSVYDGSVTDQVPFFDLTAEYHELREEIHAAIARVFETSQFILGAEVAAFEEEFARYCDSPHAIGVNSGTSALHLSLLAAGIGPGDEVLTTPFTFFATVATIQYVGAAPIPVDIDPATFNLDATRLEAAITPRTRAILVVHLYGQPADMDPILDLARRRNLIVIEDAAQAHGAEYKGRRVGSLGDFGCFSFYPTKNLGAPGEGGLITTRDPEHARTLRMLRDWGQEQKYRPVMKGYNYRLQGLQAAVLRVKLRRLEAWIEMRRAHASTYDRLLAGAEVTRPTTLAHVRHIWHLYTIRAARRDELQKQLAAEGIQTVVHYPAPIHLLTAYSDLGYGPGDFPVAEECARSVLSLPAHPYITSAQIERVAGAVTHMSANINPKELLGSVR
jgi:dTDP-4-amino-4,6-dideoxygalactose transaminase